MNIEGIRNKQDKLIGIKITYVNKKGLTEIYKLSLRKLQITGLRALLLTLGLSAGIAAMNKKENLTDILTDPTAMTKELGNDELEALSNYHKALSNYHKAAANYDTNASIKNRIEVVEKGRELADETLNFMKDKIKESLNLPDEYKVYIEKNAGGDTPIYSITVNDENDDIVYYYNEIPNELKEIFEGIINVDRYKGSGENWNDKDIKNFNTYAAGEVYDGVLYELLDSNKIDLGNPTIDNSGKSK